MVAQVVLQVVLELGHERALGTGQALLGLDVPGGGQLGATFEEDAKKAVLIIIYIKTLLHVV